MDHTRIGLDYIVENREYVIKLGTALDTTNVTVKKQVFELLSALCAYNADGYERALQTLDHFQVIPPIHSLYFILFRIHRSRFGFVDFERSTISLENHCRWTRSTKYIARFPSSAVIICQLPHKCYTGSARANTHPKWIYWWVKSSSHFMWLWKWWKNRG